MKKICCFILAAALLFSFAGCSNNASGNSSESSAPIKFHHSSSSKAVIKRDPNIKRVLFIGNSLTGMGQIPDQLADIAKSKNKKIVCDSVLASGYTLEQHYNNDVSSRNIKGGAYDYVVLQDHGQVPMSDEDTFDKYIKLFDKDIKASGAKTIIYITSRTADEHGLAVSDRQDPLTEACKRAAELTGAQLAPCGPAWVTLNQKNPKLWLYEDDNMHPSVYGGYVNACVFYSLIYHESASGASCNILKDYFKTSSDKASVKLMQDVAWQTVQQYSALNQSK